MSSRSKKKYQYRNVQENSETTEETVTSEDNKIIRLPKRNELPLNVFRDQNQRAVEHELESPEVTEEEKMIQGLPSNNGVQETEPSNGPKETPQPHEITVLRNPVTGLETPISLDDDIPDIDPDEYFEQMMSSNTLSEKTFNETITSMFSKDNIPGEDIIELMNVSNRFLNKEPFPNGYYMALPDSIKTILAKQVGLGRGMGMAKIMNESAKTLLQEISFEYIRNDDTADLEKMVKSIQSAKEEFNEEMSAIGASLHINTLQSAIRAIEEKIGIYESDGETEKAKAAEKMLVALKKAMNLDLDDFKNFCSTSKVKPYELERPDKIFKSFNEKYRTHRLTIYDISMCPILIKRHLHTITDEDACRVCIAFCKYCKNMNPDDVSDHAFMYYFIKNIIALDDIYPKGIVHEITEDSTITPEIHDFYMKYLDILMDCINRLNRR